MSDTSGTIPLAGRIVFPFFFVTTGYATRRPTR